MASYVSAATLTDAASYNALGQLNLLDLGVTGGLQTSYIYYGESGPPAPNELSYRLWQLRTFDGATTHLQLEYEYDDAGNVLEIRDWDSTANPNDPEIQHFGYDALDRLTDGSGDYGAHYEYDQVGNLTLKAEGGFTKTLLYTDTAHVHAVSRVDGVLQSYDANGNMITRTVGGVTYTQEWDHENRLVKVVSGTEETSFVYDGDGALVKREEGGQVTVYVGQHFEKDVTADEERKYYYFNGQRVAMKRGSVLQYIQGDHLGTTSLVLDTNGAVVAEARHFPYGEERWYTGTLTTDYRFTGQRLDSYTQLYHMGARHYDPYIGQFVSPDSIVPQPANPQSLNRYSYALGNPLRYRDPTGHWEEEWEKQFEQEHGRAPTEQDWWDYQFSLQIENWISALWELTYGLRSLLWYAEVTIVAGDVKWSLTQVENVGVAVRRIGESFGGDVRRFIGGVTVKMNSEVKPWFTKLYDPGGDYDGYEFWGTVYLEPDSLLSSIIHEMGHYFDEKKGHSLREYKRRLRQAGLPTRNASEDFAVAFANYVLCVPMNRTKEQYLNQFQIDETPNAAGYVWPLEWWKTCRE